MTPTSLRTRARQLRRRMTPAERRLWQELRGRGLPHFRRQTPVLSFVVDFACLRARLAIEIDGGGHFSAEKRAYDQQRDRRLSNAGWVVLRYRNEEVLERARGVAAEIRGVACARLARN